MSLDSVNTRLSKLRKERSDRRKRNTAVRPVRKKSKLRNFLSTLDDFIILRRFSDGNFTSGLLSVAGRILFESVSRPSAKFPKKRSLLKQRQKASLSSKHKR